MRALTVDEQQHVVSLQSKLVWVDSESARIYGNVWSKISQTGRAEFMTQHGIRWVGFGSDDGKPFDLFKRGTFYATDRIDREVCFEHTAMHFTAEASELGWAPGYWPDKAQTNLGNGQLLVLKQRNEEQALYEQVAGCIEVTVYND